MAKMTLLQCMNEILKRCGESAVTQTATLAVLPQQVFDNLNRVITELAQDTNFKPLETQGTLTLVTATDTYDPPVDFNTLVLQSIQNPNADNVNVNINCLTPDEFDQFYPIARRVGREGYPVAMTYYLDHFLLDSKPQASLNGKVINYRYFKMPTLFVQGTDSGTCWVNETYDRTLLCDYATWLTMEYIDHPKASYYHVKVFGDPNNRSPEGELSKFKRAFGAPFMKPRVTYNF
jgi:hypothetical protein